MKLSGELEYRIRYDVEHDLFHAQNVFNDEYITPTFVEYVQKLEKENAELKETVTKMNNVITETVSNLAKKRLQMIYQCINYQKELLEAEQFLKEIE